MSSSQPLANSGGGGRRRKYTDGRQKKRWTPDPLITVADGSKVIVKIFERVKGITGDTVELLDVKKLVKSLLRKENRELMLTKNSFKISMTICRRHQDNGVVGLFVDM